MVSPPVQWISIHAPREGSDRSIPVWESMIYLFLSTLPARGATLTKYLFLWYNSDFYPRSPRGERPDIPPAQQMYPGISIHAPREGSDAARSIWIYLMGDFYPRSPRGERLSMYFCCLFDGAISIHAPREGSDVDARPANTDPSISIHAPREGSDVLRLRHSIFA